MIAYVVGDTALHDQLCGRYGPRTKTVKQLCRHCNCPNEHSVSPSHQKHYQLWKPDDFNDSHDAAYFQACSHHKINNVFYDLDFGANPHNIHLATPGECLHMHQLGSARRAVESFRCFVMGTYSNSDSQKGHRTEAFNSMGKITRNLVLLSVANRIVIFPAQNILHPF